MWNGIKNKDLKSRKFWRYLDKKIKLKTSKWKRFVYKSGSKKKKRLKKFHRKIPKIPLMFLWFKRVFLFGQKLVYKRKFDFSLWFSFIEKKEKCFEEVYEKLWKTNQVEKIKKLNFPLKTKINIGIYWKKNDDKNGEVKSVLGKLCCLLFSLWGEIPPLYKLQALCDAPTTSNYLLFPIIYIYFQSLPPLVYQFIII